MSRNESPGAKGEMKLYYSWRESSSGHIENSHEIVLKSKDERESTDMTNITNNSSTKNNYEISLDKLISLIREHRVEVNKI